MSELMICLVSLIAAFCLLVDAVREGDAFYSAVFLGFALYFTAAVYGFRVVT